MANDVARSCIYSYRRKQHYVITFLAVVIGKLQATSDLETLVAF